jgi:hypothetical protein
MYPEAVPVGPRNVFATRFNGFFSLGVDHHICILVVVEIPDKKA